MPLYSYQSTIPTCGMYAVQAMQLTLLHLHAAVLTISMPYGILPMDVSAHGHIQRCYGNALH